MFQLIFFKQVYIGPKSQVALRVGFWVRLWMFEKKRKLLQYSSYRHLSKLLERKFEPLTQHKRYESMNEFFTFICFKNKMISLWWKKNDPLFKCHVIVNHKRTSCPNYPMAHPTKEKENQLLYRGEHCSQSFLARWWCSSTPAAFSSITCSSLRNILQIKFLRLQQLSRVSSSSRFLWLFSIVSKHRTTGRLTESVDALNAESFQPYMTLLRRPSFDIGRVHLWISNALRDPLDRWDRHVLLLNSYSKVSPLWYKDQEDPQHYTWTLWVHSSIPVTVLCNVVKLANSMLFCKQ